jgi:hypothetical protein
MPGFKSGPWLQSTGLAACHMRLAERLAGPWLGSPVQLRSGLRASAGYARAGRTHGVVTARSGVLTGDSLATRCTSGASGWHRARHLGAALTQTVVRRGGGGEASRQRRSSAGRELWWPVEMEAQPCSVSAEEGR